MAQRRGGVSSDSHPGPPPLVKAAFHCLQKELFPPASVHRYITSNQQGWQKYVSSTAVSKPSSHQYKSHELWLQQSKDFPLFQGQTQILSNTWVVAYLS